MPWKPLDFLALTVSLSLLIGSFIWTYGVDHRESLLYIKADSYEWYYSLEEAREIHVDGPLGESIIIIQDGEAHMAHSPCDNKTCIFRGALDSSGDWTACLPNRVFLSIQGQQQEEDLDGQVF